MVVVLLQFSMHKVATTKTRKHRLVSKSPRRGQALIEFSLITPLVFLLAVDAVAQGVIEL